MSPLAVLVGAPGSGKSTVGRSLAARWGVDFQDTDADVEATAGRTISDIFLTDGEPAFRAMESAAVGAALQSAQGILALGGGAVLDPATRALLAGHQVVWLRVGLAAASSRTGLSRARPLLLGNVRGQLLTLLQERTPLYEEVATVVVDTDDRPVREVVDAVETALGART